MTAKKYNNFNWNIPNVIPTLPQGEDAERLFKAYQNEIKKFEPYSSLSVLKYNPETKEIFNSNVFSAGLLNFLIKDSGIRVAVPKDDINNQIYNLVRNKHYTDFNALTVREKQPSYEKNKGLYKKVISLAEEKNKSITYPFMIQGFYVLPDKTDKDYGIKIVPASDFEIIEDERLLGKYNNWKFDNVDEKGLPINLDKNKGSRTLYAREDGLARAYLYGSGDWVSYYEDLADSSGGGRVVFVNNSEGIVNSQKF